MSSHDTVQALRTLRDQLRALAAFANGDRLYYEQRLADIEDILRRVEQQLETVDVKLTPPDGQKS